MADINDIREGDAVTVRAKVLEVGPADVGLRVELFSKTDQFSAWVRADMVADHTPKPACPPEPEPGPYLLNNVICVRPSSKPFEDWVIIRDDGHDFAYWPGVWAELGGPDVNPVPLIPDPAHGITLPWEGALDLGGSTSAVYPASGPAKPGSARIVLRTAGGTIQSADVPAAAMAGALLLAARSQP